MGLFARASAVVFGIYLPCLSLFAQGTSHSESILRSESSYETELDEEDVRILTEVFRGPAIRFSGTIRHYFKSKGVYDILYPNDSYQIDMRDTKMRALASFHASVPILWDYLDNTSSKKDLILNTIERIVPFYIESYDFDEKSEIRIQDMQDVQNMIWATAIGLYTEAAEMYVQENKPTYAEFVRSYFLAPVQYLFFKRSYSNP